MSAKRKHVPQRQCVVCRNKYDKRQLTRYVWTGDGIMADPSGKHDGRGAYVCDKPQCRARAVDTDVLGKALGHALSTTDRRRIQMIEP